MMPLPGRIGAPVLHHLEALQREGRTGAVTDEALASLIVARLDAHCTVHVEAVVRRREARRLADERIGEGRSKKRRGSGS
jgi:hypothetical protein